VKLLALIEIGLSICGWYWVSQEDATNMAMAEADVLLFKGKPDPGLTDRPS
jgi:hypothetical protein